MARGLQGKPAQPLLGAALGPVRAEQAQKSQNLSIGYTARSVHVCTQSSTN